MFFVGPLVAYAAMLADGGNGWSPLVFLLFGVVAALAAEQWACRAPRRPVRWAWRGTSLAMIAAVSFAAARYSIGDDPAAAFAEVFGVRPPPAASHVRGWKQWYDGLDRIVAFDADPATVDHLLHRPGLAFGRQPQLDGWAGWDAARRRTEFGYATLVPFFDLDRLRLRPLSQPQFWEADKPPNADGRYTDDRLIWDPPTGQVVLVHGRH